MIDTQAFMRLRPMKPGGWYFFVVCPSCDEQIAFAEAPSQAEKMRVKTRGVSLTCPRCNSVTKYLPTQVARGQKAVSHC